MTEDKSLPNAALKELPEEYEEIRTVDLKKPKLAILKVFLSLVPLLLFAARYRLEITAIIESGVKGGIRLLICVLICTVLCLALIPAHENMHKWLIEMCGAPATKIKYNIFTSHIGTEWFLTKRAYICCCFVPAFLLGSIFLLIAAVVPESLRLTVLFEGTIQYAAGGSDLLSILLIAKNSRENYIKDDGSEFHVFSKRIE